MKTLEFLYQETQIHFLVNPLEKNVMVNATEMAKPFNKRVKNFLRLDETKNFINYQVKKNYIGSDVSRYIEENIYYSNNKAGTFMTRKLALKFAAWLDVSFEDWIFETIDNIIFGNYQKHWEAHAQQEVARVAMEDIKTEILHNPTPESVAEYFRHEREYKNWKNAKTKAIRNQLKLFGND
ncbi:KilA-N domain-containing protein [Tenacibaculum mesophilum]|uniref:KilA-N domain-containing protein n=1 Tax=Tenacibaculum mesophilum TaxID=104268 RepID=UPI00249104DF|nr:KilA-N domain-containing protein [Tenacibaculum mesophilum]